MAKQLTINDPTTGVTYTLEYTRKTVEAMEKNGFVAADVERKPTVAHFMAGTTSS